MNVLNFLHIKKNNSESSKLYLKMRAYLISAFVIIVLIPIILFGIFTYHNSKLAIENNMLSVSKEYLRGLSSSINCLLTSTKSYTEIVLSHIDSIIYEEKILKKNTDFDFSKSLQYLNKDLNLGKNSVQSINIIVNNRIEKVYSKIQGNIVLDTDSLDELKAAISKSPDDIAFIGARLRFYDNGTYDPVLVFCKNIKDPLTNQAFASALIDIDYQSLSNIIFTSNSSNLQKENIYIADENDNIMYSINQSLLTTKLDVENLLNSDNTNFFASGEDFQISSTNISPFNWKIIAVFSSKECLQNQLFFKNYIIILSSVCLAVFLVFIFVMKIIFLNPINELSTAFSMYGRSGIRSKHTESVEPKNAEPSDPTNLSNIQSLIHTVYSTKLEQKETQLKSLQTQINPHFLYNTLESIRGLALYHGIKSIAEMSRCLSSLFRYSISSELLVPIASEVKNIDEYLSIQNFRHDDKFEVVYNIPERLQEYKMLKLTLQPIIENAIKHGLEMKLGKGEIKISMLCLDNTIRIEISDDGLGMPIQKIRELNAKLSDNVFADEKSLLSDDKTSAQYLSSLQGNSNAAVGSGTGIGIQNVNSRIKLYFGNQYGVRYKECVTGTTVEISLPLVT